MASDQPDPGNVHPVIKRKLAMFDPVSPATRACAREDIETIDASFRSLAGKLVGQRGLGLEGPEAMDMLTKLLEARGAAHRAVRARVED